jgi:hypothetical protein
MGVLEPVMVLALSRMQSNSAREVISAGINPAWQHAIQELITVVLDMKNILPLHSFKYSISHFFTSARNIFYFYNILNELNIKHLQLIYLPLSTVNF